MIFARWFKRAFVGVYVVVEVTEMIRKAGDIHTQKIRKLLFWGFSIHTYTDVEYKDEMIFQTRELFKNQY